MKFRSTWIMAVAVAALAGYTFYDFKNSEDDGGAKGSHKVFSIERNDLLEIELNIQGAVIAVKREGQSWKQLKPVEDLAEDSAVEGFVYTLLSQRGKEFHDSKSPSWAEFALDAPKWTVIVKAKDKAEKMEVSSKNAYDGSYYIRVGNNLWLGDRGLAQLFDREPASFRSRKIYRGPEDVKNISAEVDFEGVRDSYKFKRVEGKDLWTMSPDPGFPLDSYKVTQWVQKLTSAHGTDFAPQGGLRGKPTMEVKLDEWMLSMTQDQGPEVLVSANKNPVIYKMNSASLDQVRVPKVFFRDSKEPFKFALEQAREIEVHGEKIDQVFVKKDQDWALKEPKEGLELDQEKLVQLIQNVQNMDAAEFAPLGQGFPKRPQFTVRDGTGKVLFSLEIGAEYKPKYGFNRGRIVRYARVSTTKDILGLPKEKVDHLIDSAIIKKVKAEKK